MEINNDNSKTIILANGVEVTIMNDPTIKPQPEGFPVEHTNEEE